MRPPRQATIAPSILSADISRLGEQIAELSTVPGVDRVHVDVMDGHFVPNLTFGPLVVEAVRRHTTLPIDVHLMIEHPERYYRQFVEAGASGLTFHVEACPDVLEQIAKIQGLGVSAGVALSPATPLDSIRPALDLADLVLVMTVVPGFGGQSFMRETLLKVTAVRDGLASLGREADLEVDGGIAPGTAALVREAGANVLVAGSFLFKHPSGLREAVDELRRSLGERG